MVKCVNAVWCHQEETLVYLQWRGRQSHIRDRDRAATLSNKADSCELRSPNQIY